ncbi:MAG: restriction endonuclease subunit S [Chloroflexota bacterium]|nr:MAG: restriction endonuclease subunit S [Chloroflexota bacterium]
MIWREATLGELARRDGGVIQTGPFGSQLHQADYQDEGIPVIMPRDIAGGRVSLESIARVSEETANRLERHKLRPRTIVLPRRGEITKRAYITAEQEGWLCGTGCLKIELNGQDLVPEYLYYFMEQGHVVRWLEQHAVGTTMLNLSAAIVANLPIRYPAAETQREIANILSAYDDLIENNRRRMALLEEAARQLYREWFVRLRFPGHEHTPVNDGVPEGWNQRPLFDLATATYGHPFQSGLFTEDGEGLPVVRIRDVLAGESRTFTVEEAPPDRRLSNGDLLIGMDGEFHMGLWAGSDAWLNQRVVRIKGNEELDDCLLFWMLRQPIRAFNQTITGTTVVHLGAKELKTIRLLVPPHALLTQANALFCSMGKQIVTLKIQNQKLRAARDLLLPRLISGEIAV